MDDHPVGGKFFLRIRFIMCLVENGVIVKKKVICEDLRTIKKTFGEGGQL